MSIGVENLTRGQPLVTTGRVADNYWTRLRGLIGSKASAASSAGLFILEV